MPNYPILEAFSSFCVSVRDKVAPSGLCRWAGAVTPARTYMWNTKSATTYRSSPKIFRHARSILSHLVALFISAAVLAKSVMSCPGRRHPSKSAGYQNLEKWQFYVLFYYCISYLQSVHVCVTVSYRHVRKHMRSYEQYDINIEMQYFFYLSAKAHKTRRSRCPTKT